jgi:hypothetical protein
MIPASALVAHAAIAKAVIDAAIEADPVTPIAGMENEATANAPQ